MSIDQSDRVVGLPELEHEAFFRRVVNRMTGAEASPDPMIGRYEIVRRLGAGGMGVVYLVRDPDLDRLVALKVLRADLGLPSDDGAFQRRMRREARAMARLDHPHVVRVLEVGEHRGRTYLVMEFVEGLTLTEWLEDRPNRSWEEIVRTFAAAGDGLAAAHAAGLAHCDFKPDNVLIGSDDAIKVSDFGVVRLLEDGTPDRATTTPLVGMRAKVGRAGRTTREGEIYGTPAFMAPEQLEGQRGNASSDQFGFCVALYSALYRQEPFPGLSLSARRRRMAAGLGSTPATTRPLPVQLERAIARGLCVDPMQRWPSMEDLLAELRAALGARARRRRRGLLGAGATLALAGFAVLAHQRYERRAQAEACAAEGASIETIWNEDARATVQQGVLATKSAQASTTADKVMPWLDAYAEGWRQSRTLACTGATPEGRLGEASLERARWCLDTGRREFAALVEELRSADANVVEWAVPLAVELPPAAACVDPVVLAGQPAPPTSADRETIVALQESLAQAKVLSYAGQYDPSLKRIQDVLARAEALKWLPLIASARSLKGQLLHSKGAFEDALAASARAYTEAAKARAWGIATDAANEAIYVAGHRLTRLGEARVWARSAEAAEQLAGDPLGLNRAIRLDSLGVAEAAAGHHTEAARLHEEALGIRERALGPNHLSLAWGLENLGNAIREQRDHDGARALYERAMAIRREALGPEHPTVAVSLNNIAVVHLMTGELEQAQGRLEQVLALRRRTLGPRHHDVGTALINLASVYFSRGQLDEAARLAEEGLSVLQEAVGPEHRNVAKVQSNLAAIHLARGDGTRAVSLFERSAVILERSLGAEHLATGTAQLNLAEARFELGDLDGALEAYQRASSARQALGPEHPELAKTWVGLAKVALAHERLDDAVTHAERAVKVLDDANVEPSWLAEARFVIARALRDEPARAVALAREAAEALRATEGHERLLKTVEQWLEDHGQSTGDALRSE